MWTKFGFFLQEFGEIKRASSDIGDTCYGAGDHQGEGAVVGGGDGEGPQQARGEGGQGDHLTAQVEKICSYKKQYKNII